MRGGTILSKFNVITLTEYDKAVHAYLRYFFMNNVPLTKEMRAISRYNVRLSQEWLAKVILSLAELVKRLEMKLRTRKELSRMTGGSVMERT